MEVVHLKTSGVRSDQIGLTFSSKAFQMVEILKPWFLPESIERFDLTVEAAMDAGEAEVEILQVKSPWLNLDGTQWALVEVKWPPQRRLTEIPCCAGKTINSGTCLKSSNSMKTCGRTKLGCNHNCTKGFGHFSRPWRPPNFSSSERCNGWLGMSLTS